MSARKRPSGWLSLPPSSSTSNKRARTPENQASSSVLPPLNQSPQFTSTLTTPTAQPNKSSSKGAKTAGYAILSTLKSSIKLLKGRCGAFKPLELVAGDLLGVLESIENSTKGHPDLLEIATELPQWVLVLSSYLSSPQSEKKLSLQLAEQLATDLKEQVENMKTQEKRGAFRQWLGPREQPEELRQSYHRIETLFRQLQADTAFNTYKIVQDQLQESRLDKMLPSHNARYDSRFALKVKRRACLPNTRATVLEDSHRWIYGTSLAKIYWLNGMAGTGKTTIAYTICSELERNGRLGANFFCSRAASDCQDVNKIVPTIAYQLTQLFYPFRSALCQTLGTMLNIAQRKLQAQITHLIKGSLLEMKEMLPSGVVVVIDALDECLDPEATQIILNLLFEDIAQLPIRFFLASRPEPMFLNTILNRDSGFRSVFHLHNVEWQIVNGDIETYLNVSLATVLKPPQIKQIANLAGALFIYATTVVRYIHLGRPSANQQARIAAVLNKDANNKGTKKDRNRSPPPASPMSASKRPFSWLGASSSSDAPNKRATTPINQAPANGQPPSSQSPGSTSTTHLYKSTGKNVKTAGYAVLSTLKGSMKLLEGSCRAFSPFHAAAEDLLQVIESIENTTKGDLELFEIASELPQWTSILSSYLMMADSDPEVRVKLAERLAGELEGLVKALKAQAERGNFREWLKSNEKAEELRQCYRRIETSFRQLQCDKTFHTWKNTQEQLQDLRMEKMSPSHDARYDSSFAHKVKRGECLKNTRATVLEDSSRWIYGVNLARIFWLNGMAGTGKTTIAYTICSELEQNERLGASFFCSRAASDCQDVNRMIPTIAYQLAQRFYSFRSVLCQQLAKGASLAQRKLSVQFNHLIKEPLLEVRELLPNGVVVVIDALDECSDAEATKLVLELLLENAAQLPVRFFLTSRPEPSIVNTLFGRGPESHSVLHLHNVEQQLVNADIETYLTVSLAQITISQPQIRQLALQAGVLFIYATTLARYILSGHAGANRQTRLAAVLNHAGDSRAAKKDREIDRLYMVIVEEALNAEHLEQDEVDVMKHILWIVTTVREPVTRATLAGLLSVDEEYVSVALEPLRSVLNLIEGSDVVAPLHASFPEFVLNPERSGRWSCCDHRFVAIRCFNVMQNQLRFNIGDLKTSSQLDQEVTDLSSRVKSNVSSELLYACRYWSTHLRYSAICSELLHCLNGFLSEGLLFWMEVLNLAGQINRGERMISKARRWLVLEEPSALEVIELAQDSYQFVHAFAHHPVHWSTPHIYISSTVNSKKK